ncbi:vitamin K epoxide reductase family protein [Ornithinimicrobium murale]|uniref:vitamin K epoxide reductase family protein n=1 Tax=Ornithinimicrobium murale TaxID=1050153 RepID=UPI000E0CCC45|nr:vitamin K epoxide reductase family protein [Ornithinimicrobium murale]
MAVRTDRTDRTILAPFLIVAGLLGLLASFQLTLGKLSSLENPQESLTCDFSVLVQCSANIASEAGAVLGFPNPLIGLMTFVAPVAVGAALLARAEFAGWFWLTFQTGITAGMVFVTWLQYQSIFVLGTLCPWCMVTWAVIVPLFWAVTLRNTSAGLFSNRLRPAGDYLGSWIIPLVFAHLLAVALVAQFRLDVLARL